MGALCCRPLQVFVYTLENHVLGKAENWTNQSRAYPSLWRTLDSSHVQVYPGRKFASYAWRKLFKFETIKNVLSHLGHKVNQDCLNKMTTLCPCERLYSTLDKLTFMQLAQTDGFQHIHLAAFLFAVKHQGWQTALGWFCRAVFHQVCLTSPTAGSPFKWPYTVQGCHIALLQFSMSTHKHFRQPSQFFEYT